MSVKVGILGVSGYTGLELLKILLSCKDFEISYLAATNEGKIDEIFPQLKGICDLAINVANVNDIKKKCELLFVALPHMQSMQYIKELRNDIKIVDLSADYRVSLDAYEKYYGGHIDVSGLNESVYGLTEINKQRIKNATLVANPGCYPTCSLLALIPFAKFIDYKAGIFIDAKSGVSGAGKGLKASSHFISVNENSNAYSPLTHRHSCEIKEHFENVAKEKTNVYFVPHLLPISRGMLASSFVTLSDEFFDIEPLEILRNFYKNDKFIRIKSTPPEIKNVAGTHFCDIFAMKSDNKLIILSAIDNLLKGASSQAVANANLMCGFDEYNALPHFASFV